MNILFVSQLQITENRLYFKFWIHKCFERISFSEQILFETIIFEKLFFDWQLCVVIGTRNFNKYKFKKFKYWT